MIRIGQISRPTQMLIAVNVVLSLVIALQLVYPTKPNLADADAMQGSAATMPEFGDVSLSPPRMAELADMLDRPLFFVDRRMPEPPKEQAPAAPPTPLRRHVEMGCDHHPHRYRRADSSRRLYRPHCPPPARRRLNPPRPRLSDCTGHP